MAWRNDTLRARAVIHAMTMQSRLRSKTAHDYTQARQHAYKYKLADTSAGLIRLYLSRPVPWATEIPHSLPRLPVVARF